LRSCIVAEEGYTLLSLDASQIELRVLAILSQDPRMLEDLQTGDLHQATATRMWGWIEDEELRKRKRYEAKQVNFAIVYGAEAFKVSQMLECSEEEAEQFMAEHKEAYPVLYQWMDNKVAEAREQGYVINMFGRIRPLPELYAGNWKMREKAEREIVNTLCQGTAVDIVKLAMITLRSLFNRAIRLILQVHDELLWEVPDSMLGEALSLSKELIHYFPDYPFSITTGKIYSELKEVEWESQKTREYMPDSYQ